MNPNYDLLLAIENNNISKVIKAFNNGADTQNINLTNLIKSDNIEMTRLLLKRGINNNNKNLLLFAIENNNLEMIKLLIKYLTPVDNEILSKIKNYEILRYLFGFIKEPYEKTVIDYDNNFSDEIDSEIYVPYETKVPSDKSVEETINQLLINMIEINCVEGVRFILENEKTENYYYSECVLDNAIKLGNLDIIKLLFKEEKKILNYNYSCILWDAIKLDNIMIVKFLIKKGYRLNIYETLRIMEYIIINKKIKNCELYYLMNYVDYKELEKFYNNFYNLKNEKELLANIELYKKGLPSDIFNLVVSFNGNKILGF